MKKLALLMTASGVLALSACHAGTSTDVGSTRHNVTGWLIHWDQIRSELGTP